MLRDILCLRGLLDLRVDGLDVARGGDGVGSGGRGVDERLETG